MEIKGIKYIGPFLDNSGYAQAARGNIMALHSLGVPLTLQPVSFENARPDLGKHGEELKGLIEKDIDYNIVLTHTTPEFWAKYKEEGKAFVGYTIWETTKLHPDWPGYINDTADKVLVGSEWNVDVFEESGVTKPIGVVPHGIDVSEFEGIDPFDVSGVSDDAYVFYSVFQWTERKHPLALIKAYWHAFQKGENVAMVLKTYRSDYSEPEKNAVRTTIKRLKTVMPMENYPPIYLISHMLTNDEILGLHARGNCYASLDRGEGFGLSPFAAGACGNPIIVTGFGGSTEYAKEGLSYLVDYSETPVFGMPWCMSLNSLVNTKDGYKKARDVREGDEVRNKHLNYKNINKLEIRPLLDAEDVYSLKHFSFPFSSELTGDHKLYVVDGKAIVRKRVEDINVGDYLYVPKPHTIRGPLSGLDDISSEEGMKKLFYLFGLYLAEGHVCKGGYYVSFSFNLNEKYTLGKKCKSYMRGIFGKYINDENIYERDLVDRNGYEINFNSSELAKIFSDRFGTGSHDKSICDEVKYNFRNVDLLSGYWDGDGHIRKEGYKNKRTGKKRISPECVAETASLDLALDLREIMLSIGIVPSLRESVRSDGRVSYIFSVSDSIFDEVFNIEANRINSRFKIYTESGFGVLVTKKELLEDFDDLICSISVDIDVDEDIVDGGSYILNGMASSNSPWYRGDQLWAEPNIVDGAMKMRHVYNNQSEALETGKKLAKSIAENFSWEAIGQRIIDEIGGM